MTATRPSLSVTLTAVRSCLYVPCWSLSTMEKEVDWNALLKDHPIFNLPKSVTGAAGKGEASLELSLSSLPEFTEIDPEHDGPTPSGRRQVMVIKDSELIVAAGSEIRMAALAETKIGGTVRKSYKVCAFLEKSAPSIELRLSVGQILHTPNIQFDIHQLVLNPHEKLLAVAGAFQVAVIVLPRTGFTQLVPATIDCKYVTVWITTFISLTTYLASRCILVGQFYHASETSAPIAKIEWHPWGDGGTTLMVMTTDGKLRYVAQPVVDPLRVLTQSAESMISQSMQKSLNKSSPSFLQKRRTRL